MTEALKPHAQPWLSLGDKLGKVAACLAQGKISKVTVTTHGAEMKSAGRYITAAVSAGIIGGNDINLVNSAVIAKEKGFEVYINPRIQHLERGHVVCAMLIAILENLVETSGLLSFQINMNIIINYLVFSVC